MSKKRFIDSDTVKELVAELHLKQLQHLKEALEDNFIEPQMLKLIWEMVKFHNIGVDGVDELAEKAKADFKEQINAIELDQEWEFNE